MDTAKTASAEEIGIFKAGAAARYRELGVPDERASALFDAHTRKTAEALGFTASAAAVKLAADLKAAMASEKKG